MKFLSSARVRDAVISSSDQALAVDMMLRDGPGGPEVILTDFRAALRRPRQPAADVGEAPRGHRRPGACRAASTAHAAPTAAAAASCRRPAEERLTAQPGGGGGALRRLSLQPERLPSRAADALGCAEPSRISASASESPIMSVATLDSALEGALSDAKAWPFEEARRIIKRIEKRKGGNDKTVLFETGYGPSGLPHIGTFGEVARTTMVRRAFEALTGGKVKTRLLCFSDDMDGMRKIPDNVPDRALLEPLPADAADRRAQSVRRRLRELRRPQQRHAAALPRHLRLRLRVRERHRVLQGRPLRRSPAARRRALRRHHERHAADARRGAAGDLQSLPADLADQRPRALRADEGGRRQGRHHHRSRTRTAPTSRSPSPAAA